MTLFHEYASATQRVRFCASREARGSIGQGVERGRGREEVGEEKGGRKWSDDFILPGRERAVESRSNVQVVCDGTVLACYLLRALEGASLTACRAHGQK
jgi:hypothetical protein